MAKNVHSTSASSQRWSRHDMLSWVNTELNSEFNKIEELCTGELPIVDVVPVPSIVVSFFPPLNRRCILSVNGHVVS